MCVLKEHLPIKSGPVRSEVRTLLLLYVFCSQTCCRSVGSLNGTPVSGGNRRAEESIVTFLELSGKLEEPSWLLLHLQRDRRSCKSASVMRSQKEISPRV